MTLNLEDLYVTSFATSPAGGSEEALGPNTQTCPVEPSTRAYTCYTCLAGCQSGGGAAC